MQLEAPLDDLLGTGAHVRVLRALAALPRDFSVSARDLARRARVAHTTAARVLRGLAECVSMTYGVLIPIHHT